MQLLEANPEYVVVTSIDALRAQENSLLLREANQNKLYETMLEELDITQRQQEIEYREREFARRESLLQQMRSGQPKNENFTDSKECSTVKHSQSTIAMNSCQPCEGIYLHSKNAFVAAREGNFAKVRQIMIENPKIVSVAEEKGNKWTLLHMYCGASRSDCVEDLISHGAPLESRDAQLRTALHLAARGSFPLPSKGVDIAVISPAKTVAALVLNRARVSVRDSQGFTPLHYAAHAGNVEVIEYLLDLHLRPVGKRAGRGLGPYFRPTRAPISATTNLEDTPLHLAALGGHKNAADALLKRGANSEGTNYLGMRPLHLAVLGGDRPECVACVNLLLRKPWRVDINAQNLNGETALHLAAKQGYTKQVACLLRTSGGGGRNMAGCKANTQLKDSKGNTAKDLALKQNFLDIVALIQAVRGSTDTTRLAKKMGTIKLSDSDHKKLEVWDNFES